MKLVSSNFREILPDCVTPLTASLLVVDFERAMTIQYALYGWAVRPDLGPCVVILRGKPYFNYDVLRDIAVNCWSGSESSLVRYLGIQGRFEASNDGRGVLPPLFRALRAINLGRRASRTQEISDSARADSTADVVKRMDAAHAAFCAALVNHLLIGTAAAIVYEFTESLLRLISRGSSRISVHELHSQHVETASGRQQQAFRSLVAQWRSVQSASTSEPANSDFRSNFNQYLVQFGHRCAYELELATPRLSERPELLMDDIRKLAAQNASDTPTVESRRLTLLRRFAVLLSQPARRWIVRRENSKSTLAERAAALRKCFLLAGEQLTGRGIGCREEVFLYAKHEIMEAMVLSSPLRAKGCTCQQIPDESRRELQRSPLPEFLDTTHRQEGWVPREASKEYSATLEGTAVSKGTVLGRVRKLSRPEDGVDLAPGSILVVRALDSGWTAALLQAHGVVTEVGGVLSHAAIVAREHSIPAVFNVTEAVALLSDGMQVELDGGSGRVRIVSAGPC
jgi:phosphohistidine swiveling domain-containing protein